MKMRSKKRPAIMVVGNAYRHSSIRADPYTRTFTPFEQLGGQGYVWELVFGATRDLLDQKRVEELSPSNDTRRVRQLEPYEKALSIDTGTMGWIKEYWVQQRRAGDSQNYALRLTADFLRLRAAEGGPRSTWGRPRESELRNFYVERRPRRGVPSLLVIYDDGLGLPALKKNVENGKRDRSSPVDHSHLGELLKVARAATSVVVQTDVATDLWSSIQEKANETVDDSDLLEKTLFVTRSRVLSGAPQGTVASGDGPGIRTHLSLDTALTDLQSLITEPSESTKYGALRRRFLERFRNLIVRLDRRAAVYITVEDGKPTYRLMFNATQPVDLGGYMLGYTTILTACLAKNWVLDPRRNWETDAVREAIFESFLRSQLHYETGFRVKDRPSKAPKNFGAWNTWVFFRTKEFAEKRAKEKKRISERPTVEVSAASAQNLFELRLLKEGLSQRGIAKDVLKCGPERTFTTHGLPFTKIGKYVLIDRTEIDAFASLQILLRTHMQDALARRPFNIAVFGAPGSGKSFGVEQVADSLRDAGIPTAGPKIELNLSQFRGVGDLCKALHRVRNEVLGAKVPLVFFDEFDTPLDGRAYGWLKLFLAPMQDGKFLEGETEYNLGRPIFVFAGGVNRTFAEMSARVRNPDFSEAKGPDFISRLRWHVDIAGVEAPTQPGSFTLHQVRRAILIRGILERSDRWRESEVDRMPVDAGLTAAFLDVSKFRHGVRSIEAILSMCRGERGMPLRVLDLPPEELLDMHVDAREFLGHAARGSGED